MTKMRNIGNFGPRPKFRPPEKSAGILDVCMPWHSTNKSRLCSRLAVVRPPARPGDCISVHSWMVIFFKQVDTEEIVFPRDRDRLRMKPVIDSAS